MKKKLISVAVLVGVLFGFSSARANETFSALIFDAAIRIVGFEKEGELLANKKNSRIYTSKIKGKGGCFAVGESEENQLRAIDALASLNFPDQLLELVLILGYKSLLLSKNIKLDDALSDAEAKKEFYGFWSQALKVWRKEGKKDIKTEKNKLLVMVSSHKTSTGIRLKRIRISF